MAENEHISGIVKRVVFRNEENGYIVLELNTEEDNVIVTGELGEAEEGEFLSLWGTYIDHLKYGVQFQAEHCERKLPDTAINIERYLASGIIKGIGVKLAKQIVKTFGTETLEILENEPQKLLQIRTMTQKKCDEIAEEAKKIFALRNTIAYFDGYGIKTKYAMRAFRAWGEECRNFVQKNPYLLCTDAVGMDFQKTEIYAHALHIPKTASCRIYAGMVHILRHNTLLGHTCLPLDRLATATINFLEINEQLFYKTYQAELQKGNLIEFCKGNREFVYLPEYYLAERHITDRIALLNQIAKSEIITDNHALIEKAEKIAGVSYAEKQKQAIYLSLVNNMLLLTGGPGTGKTTTLNAIIYCLEQQGNRVCITAPTGRAAKRISDLTGYEAKTIHRLLGVQFDSAGVAKFIHHEENPLHCDVLIIDEVSMVDVLLFSNLLRALKTDCKLILVGDNDQLPSVGAGALLKHLLESHCMHVITLKEIFRQAQQSYIITNAHKIVNGEMPDLTRKDNDFFFFYRPDFSQVSSLLIDLACKRLPNAYQYSPIKDIQVITPTKQGLLGTVALNKALQARLNPPEAQKSQVKSSIYTFRASDKVMQTKNNYDITWSKNGENGTGIFNGDIGTIISVNCSLKELKIDFDGRETIYPFTMIEQLELAYAITVHKSQGSEFEAVIIPMLGKMEKLTYRNLFYTAVTRAKKLLILIGSPTKIKQMVDNTNHNQRYSCLKYMLQKAFQNEVI